MGIRATSTMKKHKLVSFQQEKKKMGVLFIQTISKRDIHKLLVALHL